MKEILFATDFSERSDRALRRAILIAKVTGARLTLLHVIDDDRPRRIVDGERDSAEQLLNEQAHTLATVDGITSRAQIMMAAPAAGLAKASENSAYDLLILGQHRRQLIRDAFVGTTAERTIRQVKVPVLMSYGQVWVTRRDQAARFWAASLVATPSVNLTPPMTRGNWLAPLS